MNLFMQGMRRSGTTIIFDILSQDPRLDLYYEPFSAGRKGALGGGSGVQEVDLMDKIRTCRKEFLSANKCVRKDEDFFNYGAPRNPGIELNDSIDPDCKKYIQHMADKSEHSVFKFTRMYKKSGHLNLSPDSFFLLLVRDPKEVVASYLYGRDQCRREKYHDRESFFTRTSKINPWKSRDLYNGIVGNRSQAMLSVPDWIRPLILWDYTFRHTFYDAAKAFGSRFRIFRYEDLASEPTLEVKQVYNHIGLPADKNTLSWASENVRCSFKECYRDDPRWINAFTEYGILDSIQKAGYGDNPK